MELAGAWRESLLRMSVFREVSTRGTLLNGIAFLSIAHAGSLLAGYFVNVCLARMLGPTDYGVYGVVISFVVWIEAILTAGLVTAAYKTVSEHPQSVVIITWTFGRYIAFFAIILLGATFITSRPIAAWLGDPRIALFLSIASVDLLIFGFYRLALVVQSALRHFYAQTLIILTYAAGKVAAIVIPVWWGFGVLGAVVGNIVASALALMVGFHFFRRTVNANPEDARVVVNCRRALGTAPAIALGSLGHTLSISADLWMVEAYAGAAFAGHYLAALTVAKLFLIITQPLGNVVMPFIAGAMNDRRTTEAKRAIRRILKLFLIFILPVLGIVVAFAGPALGYFFSVAYAPGAPFLRVLAVGYVFVSLVQILNIILVSLGQSQLFCRIGVGFGLISLPLYSWSVQTFGPIGAAYTLVAISFATLVCGALAIRQVFYSYLRY